MSLSERLKDLSGIRTIIRLPRLPTSPRIEQSLARTIERYDRPIAVDKVEYDSLIKKLLAGASVSNLTLREVRLTVTCLFEGERRLIDDARFLTQYLGALRSLRSRIAIRRLIGTYIAHFDPRQSGIRELGHFLTEAISSIDCRWDWPQRHRQFKLFDPDQAAFQLLRLTTEGDNPRQELAKAGLVGPLSVSNLAAHVFLEAMKDTRRRLEQSGSIEDVDRLAAWVRGKNVRMHFSEYRNVLADTLLLPWTSKEPDHRLRETIQNYLLEFLGDPRINKDAWVRSDEAARSVIIRWLAKATLEQFLKVVDRVAAKHQWDYRKAFWSAYIEKQFVSNSWVGFGTEGAEVAKRLAETSGDKFMRQFATLGRSGSNQAVLLLQIHDLIIADWSHNGRLRIWRHGNSSAPEFGSASYIASQLRASPEFEIAHLPPDGWQPRAEAYIRRHTGIKLVQADYMPRRRGS
jgi:EH_Signature domain